MTDQTTRAEEGASDADARALIADLEREFGVTGTAAVFRKALAIAKEAAAKAHPSADDLAQHEAEDRRTCAALKVWHEIHDTANVDDDPADLEHAAMSFALAEADKMSSAESRAASAEAEVERLQNVLERERARSRDDRQLQVPILARAEAAEASASALRDRVAVLESALKPFAKAGELFDGLQARDNGQEYSLCSGNDLRAARAALKESTHV